MNLPTEIESGHGVTFRRDDDYKGLTIDSRTIERVGEVKNLLVCASYEGRAVWADSDHFEYPDWTYFFMLDLKEKYKDKYKIWTQRGDKGWLHILFSEK